MLSIEQLTTSMNHGNNHGHSSHNGSPHGDNSSSFHQDAAGQEFHHRVMLPKLDLVDFDGSKPADWLENCNLYFDYYNTPERYKVQMASRCFVEEAADWYSCFKLENPILTWLQLIDAVFDRFKTRTHLNPVIQFMQLSHDGTVADLIREFEKVKARLIVQTNIKSDFFMIWSFISKLKPDIQKSITLFKPKTLNETFDTALEIETALTPHTKSLSLFQSTPSPTFNPAKTTTQATYKPYKPPDLTSTFKSPIPTNTPTSIFKANTSQLDYSKQNLTYDEMRALKLCFNCKKNFVPGHKCSKCGIHSIEEDVSFEGL